MKRVHKDGSAQITEKKSRFIGDVYNIENEEDALYYINETKRSIGMQGITVTHI